MTEAVLTIKARAPWYSEEIAEVKRKRRNAEKTWRKTKLNVHLEIFKDQKRKVKLLMDQAREDYYGDVVEECEGDQKKLFRVVNKLLHRDVVSDSNTPISATSLKRIDSAFGN
eukprot:GHVO01056918.1.p1 GENE.GHVO01056918.1~~GHVO01056918.1.p1  ORF type:complete len:113 (+),score=9.03 GHVO01056918.1:221-559(+)